MKIEIKKCKTGMGSCRCGDYITTLYRIGKAIFVRWGYYDGSRQDGYGQQASVEEAIMSHDGWEPVEIESLHGQDMLGLILWAIAQKGESLSIKQIKALQELFPRVDFGYSWKLGEGIPYKDAFSAGEQVN
jgi:hypothetical protein